MIHILEQIKIDKRSNYPITDQIFLSIFNLIMSNQLPNFSDLPSIEDLSKTLNIKPSYVEEAYHLLDKYQYIKKVDNRYFIAYYEINSELFSQKSSISKSIIQSGQTPSSKFIHGKKVKMSSDFYEHSKFDKVEPIYEIKRLFYADQMPVLILTTYLSLLKLPNFDKYYDGTKPLYEVLKTFYGISFNDTKRHIKVVNMPSKNASLLNELPGTATFLTSYNFLDQNDSFIGYAEIMTSSHYAFSFDISI